jgi:hypothetical protein
MDIKGHERLGVLLRIAVRIHQGTPQQARLVLLQPHTALGHQAQLAKGESPRLDSGNSGTLETELI